MKYNYEMLDSMASEVNLLDYVEQTGTYIERRSGSNYYCKCFKHDERTASLCIDTNTNLWHCFGCGIGGTIYQYIMERENLSFDKAVQKVASITGHSTIDYVESESISFFRELKKFDRGNIKVIRPVIDYKTDYESKFLKQPIVNWEQEGIRRDVIELFDIRYDNNSKRIVYPVYDKTDNLIGVKGRTTIPNWKEIGIPKYINYHKIGTIDYFQGLHQTKEYILNTNQVIIFEGLKSVMKCFGWGYKNCMSAETSALSDGQLKTLIELGVKEVVIAFDKDKKMQSVLADKNIITLKMFANISIVIDRKNMLEDKDAPCDKGLETWEELYKNRIYIN